jgi:hypothetical protein
LAQGGGAGLRVPGAAPPAVLPREAAAQVHRQGLPHLQVHLQVRRHLSEASPAAPPRVNIFGEISPGIPEFRRGAKKINFA